MSIVFQLQKVLQTSLEEICIGGGHPSSHYCILNLQAMRELKEKLWVRMKLLRDMRNSVEGQEVGGLWDRNFFRAERPLDVWDIGVE